MKRLTIMVILLILLATAAGCRKGTRMWGLRARPAAPVYATPAPVAVAPEPAYAEPAAVYSPMTTSSPTAVYSPVTTSSALRRSIPPRCQPLSPFRRCLNRRLGHRPQGVLQ